MIKEILARNNIFNSLIIQLLDIKARIYFFVHRNLAYRQLIYTTEYIYISIFLFQFTKIKCNCVLYSYAVLGEVQNTFVKRWRGLNCKTFTPGPERNVIKFIPKFAAQ